MTRIKKRIISLLFIMLLIFPTLPAPTSAASLFIDVKTTDPNYGAIEWAYNERLTKGYPDGSFKPDITITESQLVSMFIRYDCTSPNSFPNKIGEHKASGNYRYLQANNIPLRGLTNQILRDSPISKGQVARMIAAFKGLDLSEPEAIQYLYINDFATGLTGKNNYQDFKPKTSMTRGEAVDILHRLSKQTECNLIGLKNKANGKDNTKYELPVDFMDNGTITFDPPEVNTTPPDTSQTGDKRVIDVDIEKPTLIANGIDSTFVTISMKSCSGNAIPYENSISFSASSSAGAVISQANEVIYEEPFYDAEKNAVADNIGYEKKAEKPNYNAVVYTDGPDLTVKIKAPKSKKVLTDTISFKIDNKNIKNMDCYKEPITLQLNYVPQAELRVETSSYNAGAEGITQKWIKVTATVVLPGGEIIRDYNGRVQFRSAEGATLSNQYVNFSNGVASTTVMPIQSSQPIIDFISADIYQIDTRYSNEIQTVFNENHGIEVLYEAPLQNDVSCPIDDLEVAFIIDSSGSMLKNDPDRLRVTKSEEFITALNAPQNISADFNSRGRLLSGSAAVNPVKRTFKYVIQSGGTNIGSGLETAFDAYKGTGQRVAILLTDGRSDKKKVEEMIEKAIKENIKVFTIGLGSSEQLHEELLQSLATRTGGTYHHVEENIDIGTAYQSIFSAITCGVPMPSCSHLSQAFSSPKLLIKNAQFYMNTYIRQGCGDINRVVLRFKSNDGDIDYDLVNRGQNYFALKKGINEISNFELYEEGIFLAYDKYGNLVGKKSVKMKVE